MGSASVGKLTGVHAPICEPALTRQRLRSGAAAQSTHPADGTLIVRATQNSTLTVPSAAVCTPSALVSAQASRPWPVVNAADRAHDHASQSVAPRGLWRVGVNWAGQGAAEPMEATKVAPPRDDVPHEWREIRKVDARLRPCLPRSPRRTQLPLPLPRSRFLLAIGYPEYLPSPTMLTRFGSSLDKAVHAPAPVKLR